MAEWWSIEILDGATPATRWQASFGDRLTYAALLHDAQDWSWHEHTWGVVFEVAFVDEAAWEAFLASTIVRAALDAVPDPLSGLLVYRGRGGSSGRVTPRKPRPLAGAGAAALPLPEPLDDWLFSEPVRAPALLSR